LSTTEAEAQAVASLTDTIIGDFAKKGGYEHIPVVAEATAVEVPQPVAAAPVQVPNSPVPAAPAAPAPPAPPAAPQTEIVPEVLSFTPDVPEDLQALIDEPDFEEEAAAEVAAKLQNQPDEYIDVQQQTAELAKDKRIAFLEAQLVAKSRKGWVAENLRAYPLLRTYAKDEVERIDATSRRAFAREAAALNGRLETIAKPMLEDIARLKAETRTEALAESKNEAKARWGNVPGDIGGVGPDTDHDARLAAAEAEAARTGSTRDIMKVMLEKTPLV